MKFYFIKLLLLLLLFASFLNAKAIDFERIGQFGGRYNDMLIKDDYAYLSSNHGLIILDISDRSNPQKIGEYFSQSSYTYNIFEKDNYIYLSSAFLGLEIIDVSDKTNPIIVGQYDSNSSTYDVEVIGNYAYLADGANGLSIIDISYPQNPVYISGFNECGLIKNIEIISNMVYVSGFSCGAIVDISNPLTPFKIDSENIYDIGKNLNNLKISNNYLFELSTSAQIHITDITTPSLPEKKTFINSKNFKNTNDVSLRNNYAYTVENINGLSIIDISDISNPFYIDTYSLSPMLNRIDTDSGYTFLLDYLSGFSIIDTSNIIDYLNENSVVSSEVLNNSELTIPEPLKIGKYNTYDTLDKISFSNNGILASYKTNLGLNKGLVYLDITDSTNPKEISSFETVGTVTDFQISGNYVYVTQSGSGFTTPVIDSKLSIIDISNPSKLMEVGSYKLNYFNQSIKVMDNYAYILETETSFLDGSKTTYLSIIDIVNPDLPTLVSSIVFEGLSFDIELLNNYLYIANGTTGLTVVDITDKKAPVVVNSIDTIGTAYSLKIHQNYLYLADDSNGLLTFDISNNSSPILVHSNKIDDQIKELFINNEILYTGKSSLNLFDISSPSIPSRLELSRSINDILYLDFVSINYLDFNNEYVFATTAYGISILKEKELVNISFDKVDLIAMNTTVTLNLYKEVIGNISINELYIDYGNGNYIQQNVELSHFNVSYDTSGEKTIRVKAIDNNGIEYEISQVINVYENLSFDDILAEIKKDLGKYNLVSKEDNSLNIENAKEIALALGKQYVLDNLNEYNLTSIEIMKEANSSAYDLGIKAVLDNPEKFDIKQSEKLTKQFVSQLPNNWNLVGTMEPIDDLEIFSESTVIWVYINSKWEAWSPKTEMKKAIQNDSNINEITYIPKNSGIWILR